MQNKKREIRSIINYVLISLFFILSLASCQKEDLEITPTSIGSAIAIDPTIAVVLARDAATAEAMQELPDGAMEEISVAVAATTAPIDFICEPPMDWVAYTIQSNDTLFAIANALGIAIDAIKSANCKLNNALIVGEILYLPQYPPIPQAPSAYQQTNPSTNTTQEDVIPDPSMATFSLDSTVQELSSDVQIELFAGAGGQPPTLCPNIAKLGEITMLYNGSWSIQICVQEPQVDDFSVSLIWPTGKTVSIELSPDYYSDYYSGYWLGAHYSLPREAPSGSYIVSVVDYPEKGMVDVQEEQVLLEPRLIVDKPNGAIHLSHFEPGEKVWLVAHHEDHSTTEPIQRFAQQYPVNSQGYRTIDVAPEIFSLSPINFVIIDENSNFVTEYENFGKNPFLILPGSITVANNSPNTICQLRAIPTKTGDWTDYLTTSSALDWTEHLLLARLIHLVEDGDPNSDFFDESLKETDYLINAIRWRQDENITEKFYLIRHLVEDVRTEDDWVRTNYPIIDRAIDDIITEDEHLIVGDIMVRDSDGEITEDEHLIVGDIMVRDSDGEITEDEHLIVGDIIDRIIDDINDIIIEDEWTDYLDGINITFREPIENGEVRSLAIEQNIYDIEALNCNGEVLYKENYVKVSDETTWTIP